MKSKILYVLIFAFLVFVSFYYGGLIKKNTLLVNDFVIRNIYDFKDFLFDKISKHFNQAEQIDTLRKKNLELERSSILLGTFANELNRLLEDQNSSQYFPNVSLVRVISYVQMNDYKRVWLDTSKNLSNQIRGLVYQGYTAGIAINKDGKAMALLQGDEQCIFSVYIGKEKFPGFLHGQNDKVFVKFIPKWANIKEGDEILTSGLDEIFFPGVPVGVVLRVFNEEMYQSAEVKPYAELNIPAYLYIVERL